MEKEEARHTNDDVELLPESYTVREADHDVIPPPEERESGEIVLEEGGEKKKRISGLFLLEKLFVSISIKEIKQSKFNYILSFVSVCFVVSLCTVLLSILTMMPIVFVLLGQSEEGSADIIVKPNTFYGSSLNFTVIQSILQDSGESSFSLNTPRIKFSGQILGKKYCRSPQSIWYPPEEYGNPNSVCPNGCFDKWCESSKRRGISVEALDFKREYAIGTSVSEEDLADNEVILTEDVAGDLRVGDTIFMNVYLEGPFQEILNRLNKTAYQEENSIFILELVIKKFTEPDSGLIPSYDTYALVNMGGLVKSIQKGLSPIYTESQRNSISSLDAQSLSSCVNLRIPKGLREQVYIQSSYEKIRSSFMQWGDKLVNYLTSYKVEISTPVLSFLKTMDFFISFIGLIMSIVVFVVGVISVLLINSLLSVLLESKAFDIGIQRTLGFRRLHVVLLVLTNTYVFTIPAWIMGLIFGQMVYFLVVVLFDAEVGIRIDSLVSLSSIGWATLVAFLIPLISSLMPIRNLLRKSLSEALNLERERQSGVIYKIKQKGKEVFNKVYFGIGLLFFVFGSYLYLVLPSSLLSQNLAEMFVVFFSLLMGMLFGFVLLVLNFQRLIETIVLYAFLFWESTAVFNMVNKNLISHRLRNRNTMLLYSLSLTFIIFVSVAFELESNSIIYGVSRDLGCSLSTWVRNNRAPFHSMKRVVFRSGETADEYFLFEKTSYSMQMNMDSVSELFKSMMPIKDNTVRQFSYRLRPIFSDYTKNYIASQDLYTLGRFRKVNSGIRSIAPSLFDTLYSEFITVDKLSPEVYQYGLSESLYTEDNLNSYIVSTSAYSHLGFRGFDDIGVVRTKETSSAKLLASTQTFQVNAVLDSAPVVSMHRYPGSLGDVLCSIPTAAKHSMIPYFSVRSLYVEQLLFDVPNEEKFNDVKSAVDAYLAPRGVWFWQRDIVNALSDFLIARVVLNYFFLVCEIVILVLCFFSLSSNMSINIISSSKDVGILLALGTSHFHLYRIFIWEAFVLVISAAVVGLCVGLYVAFILQMQTVLFSQLPLHFIFPYPQMIITLVIGVLSALIASYIPLRKLLASPSVSAILRRTR